MTYSEDISKKAMFGWTPGAGLKRPTNTSGSYDVVYYEPYVVNGKLKSVTGEVVYRRVYPDTLTDARRKAIRTLGDQPKTVCAEFWKVNGTEKKKVGYLTKISSFDGFTYVWTTDTGNFYKLKKDGTTSGRY